MIPLWNLSLGYSPALRHGSLVRDSSFQQLRGGMATGTQGLTTALQWHQCHFTWNTFTPGVSTLLQRDKVLKLLLITDCNFPKQKYSSNSCTGSRKAAGPWARILQLKKVSWVWGSLYHWGTGPVFFQVYWRLHSSFHLLSIFINVFYLIPAL